MVEQWTWTFGRCICLAHNLPEAKLTDSLAKRELPVCVYAMVSDPDQQTPPPKKERLGFVGTAIPAIVAPLTDRLRVTVKSREFCSCSRLDGPLQTTNAPDTDTHCALEA